MMRIGVAVISLALTAAVITNAYIQKKQFYPTVVYITKSNPSMAVIYIQALLCILMIGKLMRRIFFGQLRTAEFEHLIERSWYAVTETCLAFTVFRDDFNPKFVALFTVLLFLKSFHWLAEDRVDYMERSPIISTLFHIRVTSLLIVLGTADVYFLMHAWESTAVKGPSVQLVFGFEYAILLTVVVNIGVKYVLHSLDMTSENPWDNKAVFLLYTELVMGMAKVFLYVAFFVIMIRLYTLPLFAFRPMYHAVRNFKNAVSDVILSRRAIHNMNTLYPDATPDELQAADNVCIICREEMNTASKKLPCNHIFHTACLRSWFQRQQTCPTCRLNILRVPTATAPQAAAQNVRVPNEADARFPFNRFGGAIPLANPFQNLFPQFNLLQHPQQGPVQPPLIPQQAHQAFAAANQPQQQAGAQPQVAPGGPGAPPTQPTINPPAASTATGTIPNGTTNANIPPPPPPFSFMLPPFVAPPPPMPMVPPHLRTFSDSELRQMEGQERANVEMRIRCLRDIQLMLDSAVIMMQQYSTAAMATSTLASSSANLPPTFTTSNTSTGAASSSAGPTQFTRQPSGMSFNSTGSTSTKLTENSSDAHAGPEEEGRKTSVESSTSKTPEEEIRKRRLEKFQQAAQPQTTEAIADTST